MKADSRHVGGTLASVTVLVAVLIVVGLVAGYVLWTRSSPAPPHEGTTSRIKESAHGTSKTNLVAYILNADERALVAIDVKAEEVATDEDRARAVVQALIQYSDDRAHADSAPLPAGTKLESLKITDGVAILDFNQEFRERKFWAGSEHEFLALRALVNSLTEIPSITKVQIKVDGAKLESLGGHEDLTTPLDRDESVLPILRATDDSKVKAKR